jgi:lipid-A-disaccharide synthase
MPTLDWLRNSRDDLKLTLPTLSRLQRQIAQQTKGKDVEITTGRDAFKQALKRGHAAIAVSGTVTLELGCADVPHVMTYLAEPKMMRHYEENGRPLINLNNIILGRKFIPEVLGTRDLAQGIYRETQQLLNSDKAMQAQRDGFAEMRAKMKEGEPEAPRQDIAERLLSHLT